jgi:heme exporter protein A
MSGEAHKRWRKDAQLTARGLALRRGERLVFSGLDFELAAGELLLLRGPNGSGKSSLLRLVAGLLPPDQGSLSWSGAPLPDGESWHDLVGYLGHADAAKAELTPREDLRFWMSLRGAGGGETALERMGLAAVADLPCRMLSAGQRRRLALARIAATGTQLWLLDEPFNALDDAALRAIGAVLAEHRAEGGMVLLAGHGAALDCAPSRELDLAHQFEKAGEEAR